MRHLLYVEKLERMSSERYPPQESGSSERSPQSSSRSQVQEMGMQRPLVQGYWLGGHVRAGITEGCMMFLSLAMSKSNSDSDSVVIKDKPNFHLCEACLMVCPRVLH